MPNFPELPPTPTVVDGNAERPPQPKIDPKLIILLDPTLVTLVADNPTLPESKVDIGYGMAPPYGIWQPLNYNPITGEML